MEQNRKDYIVIRRPANNLGKPICPIYLVISREHLSKYVDKYLDGKIRTILETKSKYPINTFENESSKEVSK